VVISRTHLARDGNNPVSVMIVQEVRNTFFRAENVACDPRRSQTAPSRAIQIFITLSSNMVHPRYQNSIDNTLFQEHNELAIPS